MLASVLKTATSEMNWSNFDVVWRRILKFFPNDIPADYTSQFMDAYSLLTVGSDIDLGPPPESRQTARTEELTYLARLRQFGNSGPLEKAKAVAVKCALGTQSPARYFEAMPTAIANHVFREIVWPIIKDQHAVLAEMPERLRGKFIKRASVFPEIKREVARTMGSTFRDILGTSKWDGLERLNKVASYCAWIEIAPEEGLHDIGVAVRENGPPMQSSRRQFVWLLESLSWFPEHWREVEALLWQFALNESESGIGNNASGIWVGLFTPISPTATSPFETRCDALIKRIEECRRSNNATGMSLLGRALSTVLHRTGIGRLPASSVGGRLVPAQWRPTKKSQMRADAHRVLKAITTLDSPDEDIFAAITGSLDSVAAIGALEEVVSNWQHWLESNDSKRHELIADIDSHLVRSPESAQNFPILAKMRDSLLGATMADQVKRLTAMAWWDHRSHMIEDYQKSEEAVAELYRVMAKLLAVAVAELPSLRDWFSNEACKSAQPLAFALGKEESAGQQFDDLVWAWLTDGAALPRQFCFGFVTGRLQKRADDPIWQKNLDTLMASNVDLALDFTAQIDRTKAGFTRLLRHIQAKGSHFRSIEVLAHWNNDVIGPPEAKIVLDWLVEIAEREVAEARSKLPKSSGRRNRQNLIRAPALDEAIRLAHWWTKTQDNSLGKPWERQLAEPLTRLLVLAADSSVNVDGHELIDLARANTAHSPELVVSTLVRASFENIDNHLAISDSILLFLRDYCARGLPERRLVWAHLASYLKDKKWATFWRLSFPGHGYRALVTAIGPLVIGPWIAENPTALSAISRQIPEPSVDSTGDIRMESVTHWFLVDLPESSSVPKELYEESLREFMYGNSTGGHTGFSRTSPETYDGLKLLVNNHAPVSVLYWAKGIIADHEEAMKRQRIEEDEMNRH